MLIPAERYEKNRKTYDKLVSINHKIHVISEFYGIVELTLFSSFIVRMKFFFAFDFQRRLDSVIFCVCVIIIIIIEI